MPASLVPALDQPDLLVTRAIRADQVETDPYAYVVIEDAVDPALFAALARAIPPLDVLLGGKPYASNERWNYRAIDMVRNPDLSPLWKQFAEAHANQRFLDDFIRLFGPHIRAAYPDFESRFGRLSSLKAGFRHIVDHSTADVLLDAQIAVNTPVTAPGTRVHGPHLDMPEKLFAGLLYFRLDEDDSRGGNLEIYRARVAHPSFGPRRLVPLDEVETVRTVRYARNVFVLLLNTPHALHGVTIRDPTPHPRLFVNLVGVMRQPLFRVEIKASGT